MTPNGVLQILLFFGVVLLLTKPMGAYMARVFEGEKTLLSPVLRPFERLCYKLFGVSEEDDMKWTTYAFAMLMFSVVGILLTYGLLRMQGVFSFMGMNPKGFSGQGHDARPEFQYSELLCHQYQLAVVHAGGHRQLFLEHGLACHS